MGLIEYSGGQCLLEDGERIVGTNDTLTGPTLIRVLSTENPPTLSIQGGGKVIYVEGTSDIKQAVQRT